MFLRLLIYVVMVLATAFFVLPEDSPAMLARQMQEEVVVYDAGSLVIVTGQYRWTHDIGKALRTAHAIEAGCVQLNHGLGQTPGHLYGGSKESDIGREFSLEGMLDSFTQRKNVTVDAQTPPTETWRIVEGASGGSALDDLPAFELEALAGNGGISRIMGHQQRPEAERLLQLQQAVSQWLTDAAIKRREGLIQQQDARLHDQCPCQSHPLLLPT
jgi:hypothetical protein